MKKANILILFIILLITFFVSFFTFGEKKLYFSLIGDEYKELNIGEKYKEEGFKALYCNKYLKLFCNNYTNKVKVNTNYKDNTLYINYSISHKNQKKVITREIVYLDKESPKLVLNDAIENVCPNKSFIETGYAAYDNVDGDITDKVEINVKNNKIYYYVVDSSGNSKVTFRTINYIDNDNPIINLNGKNIIYLFKGTEYIDEGYTALDNCDGDITTSVRVENNIKNSIPGEYFVNYYVNDSNGNSTILKRKVIVYTDISTIPKNGKIVYLTFDDGPGPYTEDILNILDKYNVKATFFVTNQFSGYKDLIKLEYDKGHAIGVHTYSHNYKNIYSSLDNYINDFNNINQVIFEQTGEYSKIFRFPGGSSNTISRFNRGIMTKLTEKMTNDGYIYFDWNVDSMDTTSKDANKIAEHVLNEIENNEYSVVLMHDIKKANIESLDLIIKSALENGYTFLPLDINSHIVHHKVNN